MVNQKLTPYNYPSHVLFQFILVAFLKTHPVVKKINTLSLQIASSAKSEINPPPTLKNQLFLAAEELAGQSSPFHGHFSWNPSQGILNLLKNNCILFEKTQDFPETAPIKKYVVKSCLYSAELRDLASNLLNESVPTNTFVHFQKTEVQMTQNMRKLGNAISKMILHFRNNENVLFCLLQRQKELDDFYGAAFTQKIFKKMYRNLDDARLFLIDAYSQREFKELIPEITTSINSLHSKS